MSAVPTRGPHEEADADAHVLETAEVRLLDVLQRLQQDATLFGDGASIYEAGVVDAVEAVRALLEELDDGSGAN